MTGRAKSQREIDLERGKERFYRDYGRSQRRSLREFLGDLCFAMLDSPPKRVGVLVLAIGAFVSLHMISGCRFDRKTVRDDVITVRQNEMTSDTSGFVGRGSGIVTSTDKLFVISRDGRMFTIASSGWVDCDEPHGIYAKLQPGHTYQVRVNRGDGSKELGLPNILKIIKELPPRPDISR